MPLHGDFVIFVFLIVCLLFLLFFVVLCLPCLLFCLSYCVVVSHSLGNKVCVCFLMLVDDF